MQICKDLKEIPPIWYNVSSSNKRKSRSSAQSGARSNHNTTVYVHSDHKEQPLLGESDAIRLGIVTLDLKGASKEVEIDIVKSQKLIA